VNITDDAQGVEIWRRGMWGKGTLSRSQPAWRERKGKEMMGSGQTSLEEITARKRLKRAEFKEARVRSERLERERQLLEEGKIQKEKGDESSEGTSEKRNKSQGQNSENGNESVNEKNRKRRRADNENDTDERPVYSEEYLNKEILQIAPEEALFLMQLDLLIIKHKDKTLTLRDFLHLIATPHPDDPFLVHYVVYYHYRRHRLIVKPGLKFGVDYLLYDRPIPLTHASTCVNVLASYHQYTPERKLVKDEISWQEINLWQRLMGNVRKKLKLVYVEIPCDGGDWRDVDTRSELEEVLKRYRIREVMNSRFVVAKERDVKSEK